MNADDAPILDVLRRYPDTVHLAFLFGSMARGLAGAHSDVDVAVAGPRSLDAATHERLLGDIAMATGRPVDLIDLQSAPEPIRSLAVTTGRRLLCTDTHLYAALLQRIWLDAADFLPLRERILRERRERWIGA